MKNSLLYIFKRIFFSIHKIGLKCGIQIIPAHYYSPIPNLVELRNFKEIWAKKSELPGIDINLDDQIKNLKIICSNFQNEFEGNKIYKKGVENKFGPGFGYIEAQALHSIIRYHKPRIVIEVGSGVSTYCSFSALNINEEEENKYELIAIEPFPYSALKDLIKRNKNVYLFKKRIQEVPVEFFDKLGENDLLFIDSSHTVKTGSDVNYLILEVLPRLNPGVIVHFHDISLPYDYQKNALKTFHHRSETSLLRAFLIQNKAVEIIFCMSMLHHERQEELKEIFPEYNPERLVNGLNDENPFKSAKDKHFPSSIYLKIKN